METIEYSELTEAQQKKAHEYATSRLLEAIVNGELRFNDELNQDKLQARIDAAIEKAESMKTPWFAREYVIETCRDEIEGMAQCDAEDDIYTLINGKLAVLTPKIIK